MNYSRLAFFRDSKMDEKYKHIIPFLHALFIQDANHAIFLLPNIWCSFCMTQRKGTALKM